MKPSIDREVEMDSVKALVEDFLSWIAMGKVGKYVIIRTHHGNLTPATEDVVKLRELPESEQLMIKNLVKLHNASKIVVICDGKGQPDRLEICRFCNLN